MSEQLFAPITIVYILQLHKLSISVCSLVPRPSEGGVWSQNSIFSGRLKKKKNEKCSYLSHFSYYWKVKLYPKWYLFSEQVTFCVFSRSWHVYVTTAKRYWVLFKKSERSCEGACTDMQQRDSIWLVQQNSVT